MYIVVAFICELRRTTYQYRYGISHLPKISELRSNLASILGINIRKSPEGVRADLGYLLHGRLDLIQLHTRTPVMKIYVQCKCISCNIVNAQSPGTWKGRKRITSPLFVHSVNSHSSSGLPKVLEVGPRSRDETCDQTVQPLRCFIGSKMPFRNKGSLWFST